MKEKNYLGKGITLDTNFALSEDEIRGKFSVINPNFRNSDRSLNTTIESTTSDFMNSSADDAERIYNGVAKCLNCDHAGDMACLRTKSMDEISSN